MDWRDLMKDEVKHRECSNLKFRPGKFAYCKKRMRVILDVDAKCLGKCKACEQNAPRVLDEEADKQPGSMYNNKQEADENENS